MEDALDDGRLADLGAESISIADGVGCGHVDVAVSAMQLGISASDSPYSGQVIYRTTEHVIKLT